MTPTERSPGATVDGGDLASSTASDDAVAMAQSIALIVLAQSKRANVGHIGSCLSVADLVALLYSGAMNIDDPADRDRDRLVVSKGHAALAVYAALHLRGWISANELDTFCGDASPLGVHPEHSVQGVDFSTGSLGQGLSVSTGAALAARMDGSRRRVFVLMSDAECNEGSTWEAAMFAAHHRLGNLVAIIDSNGQQALGRTRDVIDLDPLAARWRAFGWDTHEVDGHDAAALRATVDSLDPGGRPHMLVARTTFGKRVGFMEGQIPWHYLPMSDEQYETARRQVAGTRA